jgi:glycosyltransferase involved in cell wall biosynthesis
MEANFQIEPDISDPTISIIIPTYNRAELLTRAIDSIIKQTYSDFELIIVDDASTDDTQEVVEQYDDYRISYIRKNHNEGGAAARNTGVRYSDGEYIAFCDSDDEYMKTKLERQLNKIEAEDCEAVYCRHYIVQDEYGVYKKSKSELKMGDIRHELLRGWCPASTSLFMIQKDAIEDVGGFDQDLPSFQDYDLWLRLAKKSRFCYVDDHLVAKHEHEGEQLATAPDIRLEGLDIFLEKWGDVIQEECGDEDVGRLREAHLKNIYYTYCLNNRLNGSITDSMMYFNKYINLYKGDLKFRQILYLIIVLMLGSLGNRLISSAYYTIFWSTMPISKE